MSARYAALGLLREGPAYSYELAARIRQLLGPSYEISTGQMSNIMRDLKKAGLADTFGEPRPDDKRIVYAITGKGRADFEKFFEAGDNAAQVFRRSLLVKIALAGPGRLGEILEQIDSYEQHCTNRINELARELEDALPDDDHLRPRAERAVLRLGLEADIYQLKAELGWARHSREVVSWLHRSDATWPTAQSRARRPDESSLARRDEARLSMFRRLTERDRDA
jgi:DNA-binding PadR family transcriptional regulator